MSGAIVVLVHGFNVDDPERTVGGLATDLRHRGHEVHKFCYGHAGFLDVRVANPNLAHALLSQIRSIKRLADSRDIIPIGHSNGCAIIHKAAELQQEFLFNRCIYISPALNRKAELPDLVSRCDVMFNAGIDMHDVDLTLIYRAMLAAAPTPPVSEDKDKIIAAANALENIASTSSSTRIRRVANDALTAIRARRK